jgi:hypothetical protein
LGYVQTAAIAMGMARGFKMEPTAASTPESALRSAQNDYQALRSVAKDHLLESEKDPWRAYVGVADSSVQFQLMIKGLEGDTRAATFVNDLGNQAAIIRAMQDRFSPPSTPIFWEANWGPRPDLRPDWFIKLP